MAGGAANRYTPRKELRAPGWQARCPLHNNPWRGLPCRTRSLPDTVLGANATCPALLSISRNHSYRRTVAGVAAACGNINGSPRWLQNVTPTTESVKLAAYTEAQNSRQPLVSAGKSMTRSWRHRAESAACAVNPRPSSGTARPLRSPWTIAIEPATFEDCSATAVTGPSASFGKNHRCYGRRPRIS